MQIGIISYTPDDSSYNGFAVHWHSCVADLILLYQTVSFLSLSFVTPVVKRGLEIPFSAAAPHRTGPAQQPFTPLGQAPSFQTPQVRAILQKKGADCTIQVIYQKYVKSNQV